MKSFVNLMMCSPDSPAGVPKYAAVQGLPGSHGEGSTGHLGYPSGSLPLYGYAQSPVKQDTLS